MNRFENRVAVVTGASRRIGLAVGQRIVAEGGRVVITARKPDGLAEALAVVKTRFAAALYERDEAAAAGRYPLGRLGRPDDTAAAVAVLGSDDADWITGQTLVVDGGGGLSAGL